jgi:hypothetical protein
MISDLSYLHPPEYVYFFVLILLLSSLIYHFKGALHEVYKMNAHWQEFRLKNNRNCIDLFNIRV